MILLIDNYDSFVYNLARYLEELGCETHVVRNDATSVDTIWNLKPQAIIISPGPCTPTEAGISLEVVRQLGSQIPIFGVCLGHQVIAAAYGARIIRAPKPVHGETSLISHDGKGIYAALPQPLLATRYHSLIVDDTSLPAELDVTAQTSDRLIMGLSHKQHPNFGVQFHPESILTDGGHQILANFLNEAGVSHQLPATSDLRPNAANPATLKQAFNDGQPLHW